MDPVTMALVGEALKDPKAVGEGVEKAGEGVNVAAQGLGTGIGTAGEGLGAGAAAAAQGVGGGVSVAATGIGGGFRESKIGDAAVETARGGARAQTIEANGNADATRIKALAELAASIKDLPPETQKLILDKATATQPEPETPDGPTLASALTSGAMAVSPGLGMLSALTSLQPNTAITEQQNHGAVREPHTHGHGKH